MDLAYITPVHVRCIHDASLMRTLLTYKEALSVLRDYCHPAGLALKMQLTQAVEHVESELQRRTRRLSA